MKNALLFLALLLAGCADRPDGRREAAATQSAIARAESQIHAADQANARAQARTASADDHTAAANTAARRIDDKAVILENSQW